MARHPDELCDNGCFECRDVTNGGEQHSYDIDDGGIMRVTEYRNGYYVQIFGLDRKNYWIDKQAWIEMLAEEAELAREYRRRQGVY